MKGDKEIRNDWMNLEKKSFKEIEIVLQRYDYNMQNMLASFVASICDVDVADMLASTDKMHVSQSRWLYWYAYRYMSHETYERISARTAIDGCRFTKDGIRKGIEKMNELINTENVWMGRWMAIKRMIKLKANPHDYYENDFSNPMPQKYKLLMQIPRELKDKIVIEVKNEKTSKI